MKVERHDPGAKASGRENGDRITLYQVVLLVLSLFVLAALIVDTVVTLDPEVSAVIQGVDLAACGLLAVDVIHRSRRAESKAAFWKWGWIDVLACVPEVDVLRAGRLFRVLRIVRLLRGLRVGHRGLSFLYRHRPRNLLASVIPTTLLMVAFSSVAILVAEQGPGTNIKTAEDAIWWSISTITTVGYGDRFPTTTEGRVIAMLLMIAGVGLFGILSGIVATVFLGSHGGNESAELREVLQRLEGIERRLESERAGGAVPGGGRHGAGPGSGAG